MRNADQGQAGRAASAGRCGRRGALKEQTAGRTSGRGGRETTEERPSRGGEEAKLRKYVDRGDRLFEEGRY